MIDFRLQSAHRPPSQASFWPKRWSRACWRNPWPLALGPDRRHPRRLRSHAKRHAWLRSGGRRGFCPPHLARSQRAIPLPHGGRSAAIREQDRLCGQRVGWLPRRRRGHAAGRSFPHRRERWRRKAIPAKLAHRPGIEPRVGIKHAIEITPSRDFAQGFKNWPRAESVKVRGGALSAKISGDLAGDGAKALPIWRCIAGLLFGCGGIIFTVDR